MSEHTPSESAVRETYAMCGAFDIRAESFDRFIAKVKRDAWAEGAEYAAARPGYYPDENPYGYDEDVTP